MNDVFARLENLVFPILEKYKTLEGLDQLLNPEPVTDSVFFSSYNLGARHIITAYLANNPRLDQLCEKFLFEINKIKGFSNLVEATRRSIEFVRSQSSQS